MATNKGGMELVGLPELRKNLTFVERDVFPRAMARALNRTAKTIRTQNARSVAEHMGSKVSGVKRRYEIRPASSHRPVAKISVTGDALNLAEFKARQVSRGVSAQPWGRRRIFPTAFLTRIHGNRLVMVRRKRGGSRVGRLPIRPVLGPGIAKSAARDEMAEERGEIAAERIPVELERALEYLTRRFRG
jgi:hypothetical protein